MKKSIVLFIGVVVSILIMDRIASILISKTEESILTGNSIGKVNYFNTIKDSVDLIVLGSSRALHHVDTRKFDLPAFNIGADGKKIGYCAGLTGLLSKKKQLLLVHIDHNRVFDVNYNGQDAQGLLYKAKNTPDLAAFFKTNFSTDYYLSKVMHSYPYNGKVLVVLKNYLIKDSINSSGYEPIFPTEEQKQVFLKMFAKDGLQMNVNIHKPLEVSSKFEKFVDIIKSNAGKNNSQVVFFTSPSLNKVDAEVHKKVQIFFNKKGIRYFDHLDYISHENLSLWKDHTHLSDEGAAKYSKFLIDRLMESNLIH